MTALLQRSPGDQVAWGLCAAGMGIGFLGAVLIVLYVVCNRRARQRGARAVWRTGWLLGAPGMTAILAGWCVVCLSGPRLPGILPRLAGFALLAIALRVYWLGARCVGRWRRPSAYATDLCADGIYRHLRHPQALSLCLTAGGLGLASGSLPFLCLAPLWIAFWVAYTHLEERCELIPAFGAAYLRYRERTPRLLPRLMGRRR